MELVRYFNIAIVLFFWLIWVGWVIFLRLRKNKSFLFLIYFSVFYIYILAVLNYTLFQLQSLLLLKYLLPGLMIKGLEPSKSINLIPLITLTPQDFKTSFLNILLFIPFGFGLPLVTSIRGKRVIFMGVVFSLAIELLQLVTGVIAHTSLRISDINDILFNTLGVIVGYDLFITIIERILPRPDRI